MPIEKADDEDKRDLLGNAPPTAGASSLLDSILISDSGQIKFEFPPMRSATIAKSLVFLGFLSAHWIAQFVAWSQAERGRAPVLWGVLSFPLVRGSLADQYFWTMASLNSALWAAGLTYLVDRYILKR